MDTDHRRVLVEHMDLVGGDICLDLANTLTERATGTPRDKLRTYADLVTWGERVEVVAPDLAARLRRAAAAEPAEAAAVLEAAKALREIIFRVFAAESPAPADVEALGEAAGAAASHRRLTRSGEGYAFGWPDADVLDRPIWPVALSAAELLVSGDRERVKRCASDTCGWLFLDRSRNRSRRWCDMADCGNRAKARRFQAKQRSG